MKVSPEIASTAALLGEEHRIAMLWALLDGRARTAGELAFVSDLSAQAASAHLAKLVDGGLLVVERQGRHRYFCIEDPSVAAAVEALAAVNLTKMQPIEIPRPLPRTALRFARSCYDHLAGQLGVALFDALKQVGYLAPGDGKRLDVTTAGGEFFRGLDIRSEELANNRRPLASCCLDWTERRHHLSGALGAALLKRFIELGWLLRSPRGRVLSLTPVGQSKFQGILASVAGGVHRAPETRSTDSAACVLGRLG